MKWEISRVICFLLSICPPPSDAVCDQTYAVDTIAHQRQGLHYRCAIIKVIAMNWDHIRIFLAVARSGQLLGAARRLGLNHATVGRQLTILEDAFGTRLVERQTQGCTLTAAGEALL